LWWGWWHCKKMLAAKASLHQSHNVMTK
jgi:hypothetical protein